LREDWLNASDVDAEKQIGQQMQLHVAGSGAWYF
jgi:hypothetical protein